MSQLNIEDVATTLNIMGETRRHIDSMGRVKRIKQVRNIKKSKILLNLLPLAQSSLDGCPRMDLG